jgi:GT2 family glycosyltransferase
MFNRVKDTILLICMLYTILITTYECHGIGKELLEENLSAIINQTYRPIQVIISDHSRDTVIKEYINTLDTRDIYIIYKEYKENYGSPCYNWNNSLNYATGSYIHYLAMDDMLAHSKSVEDVVDFMKLNPNINWAAATHKINPSGEIFIPKWNSQILQRNTISGPSAIIIRNTLKHIKMDPEFIWFLDLDWYYRLYKEGGKPGIIPSVIWINRKHSLQITHTVCNKNRRELETQKLLTKYGTPLPSSAN